MEDFSRIERSAHDHDDGIGASRTTTYRLLFGREGLTFERLEFTDPVPVGSQILASAGIRRAAEWALLALLPDGDMEELRPNESLDLRTRGIEKVVAFRCDRLFRATLLDGQLLWGRRTITGEELYTLAVLPAHEALYLDVPGGTDRLIERAGELDLGAAGVERIVAGPKPIPGFEVTLIYNGLVQTLHVRAEETAAAVVAAARPLFGNPGGDLVLINEAGQQLAPDRPVGEQGVRPHSRLQLRPPVVQGG